MRMDSEYLDSFQILVLIDIVSESNSLRKEEFLEIFRDWLVDEPDSIKVEKIYHVR